MTLLSSESAAGPGTHWTPEKFLSCGIIRIRAGYCKAA